MMAADKPGITRRAFARMAFAALACGMLGVELGRRRWEPEAEALPYTGSNWGMWNVNHTFRDEQGRLWLRDLSGNGHHGLIDGGELRDGVIRFEIGGGISI